MHFSLEEITDLLEMHDDLQHASKSARSPDAS